MISVVDLLLDAEQYDGHCQTELTKAKYVDLLPIMVELERRFEKLCELRVTTDGGGAIYITEFWKLGENKDFTDRLIVSIKEIDFNSLSALI